MDHSTYVYQDYELHPDPPHQGLYLDTIHRILGDESAHNVLDAGCGDGNFSSDLVSLGYNVVGIDMSASGIAIAQRRGQGRFQRASIYDDLRPFCTAADGFDAIVSVEVIEHLYSPKTFVENVYDALRPGGVFIVTTPYWGYLKTLLLAVTNRVDRNLTALWEGGHIKHFSRKTLTQLLRENGLTPYFFSGDRERPLPFLWKGMVVAARKPPLET